MAVVVEVVHPLRGRVDELHVGLYEDLPRPLTPQVATDTPLDPAASHVVRFARLPRPALASPLSSLLFFF